MNSVYINRVSKFLPNDPIANDEMEDYLGKINDTASKARKIVLRNNGIKTRYYAIDKDGNPTHNNVSLTVAAIENLCNDAFSKNDIELLSCGTSSPDYLMPSHAVMVHGALANGIMQVNTAAGNCCAGMNALKYGYFSVKTGNTNNAVCTGSERMSSWMRSQQFEPEVAYLKNLQEQPIIAFQKDFLRWMLSDGAGAVLLEPKPNGNCPLKIEWIEDYSFAHETPTCMYAGGDKNDNGDLISFSDYDTKTWLNQSIFAVKQDTKILDQFIVAKGVESVSIAFKKHNTFASEIDYILPHVSSNYFVAGLYEAMKNADMYIPEEKWFMNLKDVGNVGAGSIYLMLDALINSGQLKSGQKVLLCVPESARFSYSYALLTVV